MSESYRRIITIALVLMFGVMAFAQNKQASLEEKVQVLQDSLLRRPLMRLNGDKWRTYVKSQPKNYSTIVMLTALAPGRGCSICKQAYEEFEIVANSYRYAYLHQKSLYFMLVDFDEAGDVFQSLNLNTAPVLMHFPAKGARKKSDTLDIQRVGFSADAVSKFVQERTEVFIRVLRPPNYAAPAVVLLLAMLIGGLLYMRRNNLDFLYNKTSWGLICLLIIFAFMSGQMWNHIRGPPFIHTNPNTRETTLISNSSQMQFVAETYIVALLYAAVTAGFILMNDAADGKGDPGKRRIMAFVGLGMVAIFFSLLLSLFRSKHQGYPYSFIFK
jgi:oligosaccharyltransferase complex subunit gamma